MFVRELTADSDYFLTNNDFASLTYDGESVEYSFDLYGRLIQALIDDNDTIRVSIVKNVKPKLKYFIGTSMEDVEISNVGFVKNTKDQLQIALDTATIATVDYPIADFVADDLISDIGSQKINSKNYIEFLPVIEQVEFYHKTKPGSANPSIKRRNTGNFGQLSRKVFDKSGIYPGKVSEIVFPSQKLSADSDGLAFGMKTPSNKSLLKNLDFRDYYEKYYMFEKNSNIFRKFVRKKAEYQRFNVKINFNLTDYDLTVLARYNDISLRVSLIKDDIEVSVDIFSFDNQNIFEEATSGVTKLETSVMVHDARRVLPDEISVTNRENYDVESTVFEFSMEDNKISKNEIGVFALGPDETISLPATKIFYSKNESRSYAVTANKLIPGVAGVSNVLKILSPAATSSPLRRKSKFDINIVPGKNLYAKILVSGLDSLEHTALIYRKMLGFGERELIGSVVKGRQSIIDNDVQLGDVYIYTADLHFNGAAGYGFATTGFISFREGDMSRLAFSLQNKKIHGSPNQPTHSFRIIESIKSTPASELLKTVNESGQAGSFTDELSESKDDTTMITAYAVFRIKASDSSVLYLGQHEANRKLMFSFRQSEYSYSETYDYIVLPAATSTMALSYSSVGEEIDISSGNSFKFVYKKFRDKNFNRPVLLPSYFEVKKDNIKFALLNLPHGASETLKFSHAKSQGRITGFKAVSKDNTDCAFLSWGYSGDKSTILHFVIFANYNGYKAPIGISIPDKINNSNKLITYCDEKLGDVPGEVIYSVLPILVTGEKGSESNGAQANSTKNYPRKALR